MLNFLLTEPLFFFAWLAAIVISISVHEASHALAAYQQGDSTAKDLGRLTLNPFSHLDPWGTLFLVLAGFGWGRPVPFNPHSLRSGKWGPAIVSLAGPASNIVLAVIFALVLKFLALGSDLTSTNGLVILTKALLQINIVLAVFNLLPLPPLDGSKLLLAIMPARYLGWYENLEKYSLYILIAFILFGSMILRFLVALLAKIISLLVGFNVLSVFF